MTLEGTPFYLRWLYSISYFRAGFHVIAEAVLGLGRENLICPQHLVYCHYVNPKKFMTDMGIIDVNLVENLSVIGVMGGILFLLTYFSLWYKLHIR